jgi:hypothetical protein
MKINEIAIINESQEIEEAPIGMLKRLGTGFKGMFSKASANENMVQRSINDLYKKYVEYYTPTNEKKPTAGNMLDFLQATGYPVGKAPNAKYKTLTALMNAIKKAEEIQKQDPNKKQDQEQDDDKTVDFEKERDNLAAGMYEAVADTPLSKEDVYKIIEFVVRDSYQDDKIKKLEPGNYTQALRDKKQKEKEAQEKARKDAQIQALGYTYDPVKDAWVPGKKENTQTAQPAVTEGTFNFDPGDGNLMQLKIAGDVPTPQELEAAIKKHGIANKPKTPKKTTAKKSGGIDNGGLDVAWDAAKKVGGGVATATKSFARGASKGYEIGNDPLGFVGKKIKGLADPAGGGSNDDSVKLTKQGVNFMKSDLGIESPNLATTALDKLVNGKPVTSPKEREAVQPIINAVVSSLQDQNGRNRLKTLFKSIK